MSFAFGFGGDDIEGDSGNDHDDLVQQAEDIALDDSHSIAVQKHTLHELLSFLPSQVSYSMLPCAKQQTGVAAQRNENLQVHEILVPRRAVFDMRAQLMAEANPEDNEIDRLLTGIERGDLTQGFYEGGFKTWECSLDLVSLVVDLDIEPNLHVIELGVGNGMPSLTALNVALRQASSPSIHFTLCDYNADVLRLATAPNIFLANETNGEGSSLINAEGDLDVEDIDGEKIAKCIQQLEAKGFSFDFVSGPWGEELLELVKTSNTQPQSSAAKTLILASETIYSPKSTVKFVDTLMKLLCEDPANSKAWVAAKKVYFGVGGSVDAFVEQIERRRGQVRKLLDVKDVGVGRVILEITVQP